MNRDRFLGGIVLLIMAAFGFVFVDSVATLPIAITLAVAGIGLIAFSMWRIANGR